MIPNDFPSWKLVYYYFTKWKRDRTYDLLNKVLRGYVILKSGKSAEQVLELLIVNLLNLIEVDVQKEDLMVERKSKDEKDIMW